MLLLYVLFCFSLFSTISMLSRSICVFMWLSSQLLPRWLSSKEFACQHKRHRRHGFDLWVGKMLWSTKWQPTPVFLPGESHRQRSLVGYIMESQRVAHDLVTKQKHTLVSCFQLSCSTPWITPFPSPPYFICPVSWGRHPDYLQLHAIIQNNANMSILLHGTLSICVRISLGYMHTQNWNNDV